MSRENSEPNSMLGLLVEAIMQAAGEVTGGRDERSQSTDEPCKDGVCSVQWKPRRPAAA